MFRKPGFSLKDSGVGGNLDVIPMGTLEFFGFDGRRERMWLSPWAASLGKTYYKSHRTVVSRETSKSG